MADFSLKFHLASRGRNEIIRLSFTRSQTPSPKSQTPSPAMITALVQFKLPQALSIAEARAIFESTAPKYRDVAGLIRKYYVLSQDGGTAGGVYLWRTQDDAERMYSAEWRRFVQDKYGSEPTVTYFATPVLVDNVAGQIVTA